MANKAQDLTNKIRLELSKPEYHVRLWRHGAGNVPMADAAAVRQAIALLRQGNVPQAITTLYGSMRRVFMGEPGVSDLLGIVGPWGIALCIEVKAGKDRLRPEQEAFRDMICDHGGIWIEARDVNQTVSDFRQGLGEWTRRNAL
jgi:hypothetical protein